MNDCGRVSFLKHESICPHLMPVMCSHPSPLESVRKGQKNGITVGSDEYGDCCSDFYGTNHREIENSFQSCALTTSVFTFGSHLLCYCFSNDQSVAFCSDTSCPIVVWTINNLKEAQSHCRSVST